MSTNKSRSKKPANAEASSKASPEKKAEPVHNETIQAPYHFTPEEIAGMNIELRDGLTQIDTLNDQKKQAMQDFKLRIDGIHNRTKQLVIKLNSGTETRPLEARVEFNTQANKKKFFHPTTGEFIREDDMQPADWQLPMFKKAPDGKEVPGPEAATVAERTAKKPATAPKSSPAGATSVGDALDKAAADTQAPLLLLDLTGDDYEHVALTKAFKKAAKTAKWTKLQISLVMDRLRECDTIKKMLDTLRPFTTPATLNPTGDPASTDVTKL